MISLRELRIELQLIALEIERVEEDDPGAGPSLVGLPDLIACRLENALSGIRAAKQPGIDAEKIRQARADDDRRARNAANRERKYGGIRD